MASICGLDVRDSREGPTDCCCEHDKKKKENKSWAFKQAYNFFYYLHDYCHHKKERIILFNDVAYCWVYIIWVVDELYHIYRMSRRECARLRENVPYVKVHRYNPKHLYPKLNCYGDNGEIKVWSSCCSTYCTCFAYCYPYTAHVRPSVSQPSQAHSAFIINRCHSYSEL